jgi:hypothetical protein
LAIVECWNNKIDYLKPRFTLSNTLYGLQNRLELSLDILGVKFLVKGLQVDFYTIDGFSQLEKRFLVDMAACYDDIPESVLSGPDRGVVHVFIKYHRLRIGIGDNGTVVFLSISGHGRWGKIKVTDLFWPYLRDFPVLAEFAVDVAAGSGHGKSLFARQEVEERFFFDGIDIEGAGFPIDQRVVDASDVFSDSAVSAFPVSKPAFPWTECAFDLSILEFFVKTGLYTGEIGLV